MTVANSSYIPEPPVDYDVIIVGAGPVGLTTALLLRKFGHNVAILERHAQRYPQPRAVGIFHQAIRAFSALGLLDRMFDNGAFQNIRGIVDDLVAYVDGDGAILAQHPINGPLSKSGTAKSYAMHQPTLEKVLEEACEEFGIKVRRATEVSNVSDRGDHVQIHTKLMNGFDTPHKVPASLTARFVVGCDGANSVVRKSANIKFIEFEPARSRWLVVDVIPIIPNSSHQWKDGKQGKQYLDPKRPRTSVPSPPTRRRWEFMVMPEESTEMASSDTFIWKMLAPFDCGPETAIIERKIVYSIGGGWVETFAKGRISLAGDAAHLAPQFLGQGLNSGLRDAKSLAWRLDFALRNPGSNWTTMMKDYSSEQLGTTMQFVAAAKGIEKLLTITDAEQAKARNEMIKNARVPIPDLERVGSPGMHLGGTDFKGNATCEPGVLFIHDKVEIDGKQGLMDDVVGEGWTLITADTSVSLTDALTLETRKQFASLYSGHLVQLSENGGCKDISGRYTEWFRTSDVKAVLLRPDYYIFGTASTTDDIEQLVKSALDHICF